jgi:hypothetical protein
MEFVQALLGLLLGWARPRQSVGKHIKNQAFGPAWTSHRPLRITDYTRRRHRRGHW